MKRNCISSQPGRGLSMEDFIRRKNIENYRKQLEQTQDEGERKVLRKLLAQEQAKLSRKAQKDGS